MYGSPGNADELTPAVLQAWNREIERCCLEMVSRGLHTRCFQLDPAAVADGVRVAAVRWSGAPAEARFCFERSRARALSDWGIEGRHELQNEYCEYTAVTAVDGEGRQRIKRIEVTTELREYWMTLAVHAPELLHAAASEILGWSPSWGQLYGEGVGNPWNLSPAERARGFAAECAGHGNDEGLLQLGVPAQPQGPLNRERALFMTHPINGLDDLLYILLLGAQPYAVVEGGVRRKARIAEVFHAGRAAAPVTHLCRNSDPAAAAGIHTAAYDGRRVAFDAPPGVYLLSFARDRFSLGDEMIPEHWIRLSRGERGLYQRLELGPGDDEPYFLDDIHVMEGAGRRPLEGGYDVVDAIEVGPVLRVGPPSALAASDYVLVPANAAGLSCRGTERCRAIGEMWQRYQRSAEGRAAHAS